MKNTAFLILLTSFFFLFACSSDDDKSSEDDTPSTGANKVAFDITGAVEGNKVGSSYVVIVADYSYTISNNDGTSGNDQTFSLAFHKSFKSNPTADPTPGSYPIGTVTDLMNVDGFWVVYTDTETGQEFGGKDVSGTLTITKNSNNQLKGTFEFSAGGYDTSAGNISVSNGSFSASID